MKHKIAKPAAFGIFCLLVGTGIHFAAASLAPEKPQTAMADMSSVVPQLGEVRDGRDIPDKQAEASVPNDLEVESAFVIDLSTGEEIFSVDKTKRWPIASLSKMMSSVIALENFEKEAPVTFSATAIATEGASGSFSLGETFTVNDLIISMMVVSSNDAAVALSEQLPEGEFVALMNQKAKELGMTNTYFNEPSGLSSLNQSTLEDMSNLLTYAWKTYPELFIVSSKPKSYIKEASAKKKRELVNINALAPRPNFLGGKTGFIEESRENLMSVFSFDKRPIGILIFGAENRVAETDKIIDFFKNGYSRN
jgi:D-alanyl-D-alanine carboxypeptidase